MKTGIPLWAAFVIAVVTAVLSFAGSYGGQMLARKGAKELEKRSKRRRPFEFSGGRLSLGG